MSAPQCSACLGTRKCWVCEGTGRIESAPDYFQTCPRCGGTGVCTQCDGLYETRIPPPRNANDAAASVIVEGDVVRIRAHGEFDIDSASTLASALDDATRSGFCVVLDLAETTFLDMFALRVIVAATERLQADGRTLRVVNASSVIARLFQMTDLTGLLSA